MSIAGNAAAVDMSTDRESADLDDPLQLSDLGRKTTARALIAATDPCSDIAVLHHSTYSGTNLPPDEWTAFESMCDAMSPAIADLDERRTLEPGPVWVMTLTGSWASGPLRGVGFTASNGSGRLRGGMSGSPVFDERGRVVGLACIGQSNSLCGIVTLLKRSLPGWVTDRLMLAAART